MCYCTVWYLNAARVLCKKLKMCSREISVSNSEALFETAPNGFLVAKRDKSKGSGHSSIVRSSSISSSSCGGSSKLTNHAVAAGCQYHSYLDGAASPRYNSHASATGSRY